MLSPLTFPLDRTVDAEGRPLFEGRASKDMQAIAPLEHAVCPYPGSRYRHEKPMNVSGLRQMRGHWDDVMAGLKYLRDLYPQPAPHIRYIDLWRICNLGEHLTSFLLFRRDAPVANGQLPAPVAGIFKIVIGLINAAQQMAFAGLLRGAEGINEPLDHDRLYAFVEERKLFIGPTEVCAGPESLVREVVDVIKAEATAPDPEQKAKLRIGDEEAFLTFSYSRMNGTVLTSVYSLLTAALYSRIRQALLPGAPGEELLLPVDAQSALLAQVDPATAQAILTGILHVSLSEYPAAGRLDEAARQIPPLLASGSPNPKLRDLLGRHAETAGVVDDVARYLQLEKIGSGLARMLKQRCLAALGLEEALYLNAIAGVFSPPDARMRSLLSLTFGVEVLPNLLVQARDRTALSLTEDAAWLPPS